MNAYAYLAILSAFALGHIIGYARGMKRGKYVGKLDERTRRHSESGGGG